MPDTRSSKRKSTQQAEVPPKKAKKARADPKAPTSEAQPGSKAARGSGRGASSAQESKAAGAAAAQLQEQQPVPPSTRRRGRAARAAPATAPQAPASPSNCGAPEAPAPPAAAAADPSQAAAGADGATAAGIASAANPGFPMEKGAGQERDDDHEDPGGHPFGRDFSSASSALQGLLRKLGAGFEDILPGVLGMGGSKMKAIITGLRAFEDESQQLSSLTELCEFLSIASEDALASFPLETVVPILVQLLNMEHQPDIMLLAARAMTFMADALPTSCGAIARHGAIPVFCARLLTIEYIDLAEQSLQALEKLSHEYSHMLLQHGGLLAVLSYLDFFPTGVQRIAVVTAANMCRGLTLENADAAKSAVPILTSLLQYSDSKVVDNACVALSHITEAFSSHPELLTQLSTGGLITQALQLVSVSDSGTISSQLSLGTYFSLLKLLTTCVRSSPAVAQTLLQASVLDTLTQLLATSSMLSSGGGPATSSVVRSVDQLHDVILLLSELLPSIPDAPATLLLGSPLVEHEEGSVSSSTSARQAFLADNPQLMSRFSSQLLPLLLQVHATTVVPQVRHSCLVAVSKVLVVTPSEVLDASLRELPISNFIAGLLSGKDTTSAAYAMQMAEVLVAKLPTVFKPSFLKEGVLHAMEQLVVAQAAAQAAAKAAAQAAAAEAAAQAAPPAPPAASASQAAAPAPAPEPPPEPSRVTRFSARLKETQDKGKDKASKDKDKELVDAKDKDKVKEKAEKERAEKEKEKAEEKERLRRAMAPPPVELPKVPQAAPKPTLRDALAQRAAKFKQVHYADGSDSALETEGLVLMRRLCSKLPESDSQQLLALFEALAGNGISVFELLNSGAVLDLLLYMTGEDIKSLKQQPPAASSSLVVGSQGDAWDHAMLQRLHRFVEAALPEGSGSSPALATLVRKLQAALSSVETFPVVSARYGQSASSRLGSVGGYSSRYSSSASASARAGGTSGSAGSLSSGLAMLTQPLKLRLSRHTSERLLREYNSNIVMIEPLATMTAIEDFLYPRVLRSTASPADPEGGSSAAAAAAAAAAAKKAAEAAKAEAGKGAKAATDEAGASGRARRSSQLGASSKAQKIPEPSNRRVTRSQAAKAGGDGGDVPSPVAPSRSRRKHAGDTRDEAEAAVDEDMPDAAKVGGSDDGQGDMHGDEDYEHHEGDHEGEDEEHPIYDGEEDEDDEGGSYDDMDDGGDGELDIQPMHVHDLHVEELAPGAAEAAGPSGTPAPGSVAAAAAAAKASGRIAASAAAAAAASAGKAGPSSAAAAAPAAKPAAKSAAETQAAKPSAAAVVGQEGPKLVFYIGDRKLPPGTTVFQAVQQQYNAAALAASGEAAEEQDEDDGAGAAAQRRGRRLWDEIHTLSYRRASDVPGDKPAEASSSDGGDCAATSQGADAWAASPLSELLRPAKLPNLSTGRACKDVLQLLQLLEAVNRLGNRVAATLQPTRPPVIASSSKCGNRTAAAAKAVVPETARVLGRLPRDEFVNQKLGSKLGQQLKDVLSICGGSMPQWVSQLVLTCKFLFPFEMRRRYFYCTAFGLGRALHHMQQLNAAESGGAAATVDPGRELRVGRLQRQKVRVSRKRILESAIKVMELYAKQRTVLEIEYFGEVGTGLGPTLEFFTLLSHDLQKRSLGLWRHEDNVQSDAMDVDDADKPAARRGEAPAALVPRGAEVWHEASEYVNAPWGLFPAPLPERQRSASSSSKVVDHFRLLGRATAKALQDCRLMDLPLNYTFYKAVLGKHVDLYDISAFDPQLGHTLERMRAALALHKAQPSSKEELQIDGVAVSDLCLTFTLPGYPEYELVPGGADVVMDASNLGQYIDAVVDATLGVGIASQLQAFREGFNEVFPLSTLECFFEDELETLLCGSGEAWTVQSLADSIKFDHGYTGSSPVIKCFLEVLSELDAGDRRRFLRFVTGCPRLPPGGVAALQPQLTVVRKHPTNDTTPPGTTPVGSYKDNSGVGTTAADCDLPSVMTCANYIKLPPYSSKDILKQRLMYAISEGQGSFDLS